MYIGAGIIIHNTHKQVLLVCDARSGRWGFPKGHPESIDKNLAINTAIRECFEETGMTVVKDYLIENKSQRIGKRIYFNGIILNEAFRNHNLNKNEIQDIRWWTIEELNANVAILNSDLRGWLAKLSRKSLRSPTLVPALAPPVPSSAI